jgi:hypothetical protein
MRRDLWLRDEGLTVLLGALLLMIFIVNPLGAAGVFRGYAALVHDLWLALTLLSGALAIGWRRKAAQVVVLSAILLFALRGLGFAGGAGALGLIVDAVLTLFLLSTLALMVLCRSFVKGQSHDSAFRLDNHLSAAGIDLGRVDLLAANLDSDAFTVNLGLGQNALSARLTYFSFVTLTTVGYGDILPTNLVSRTLANMEGLVGQLFPAILIARLVSMEIAARETKNTKE